MHDTFGVICFESVIMLSNHSHCAQKVKRRHIANLIKGEEKFVAVLEHLLSNYVTILRVRLERQTSHYCPQVTARALLTAVDKFLKLVSFLSPFFVSGLNLSPLITRSHFTTKSLM